VVLAPNLGVLQSFGVSVDFLVQNAVVPVLVTAVCADYPDRLFVELLLRHLSPSTSEIFSVAFPFISTEQGVVKVPAGRDPICLDHLATDEDTPRRVRFAGRPVKRKTRLTTGGSNFQVPVAKRVLIATPSPSRHRAMRNLGAMERAGLGLA
jgi:hypothetical protein